MEHDQIGGADIPVGMAKWVSIEAVGVTKWVSIEAVGVTKWVSIEAVGMTKLAEQIFPLAWPSG